MAGKPENEKTIENLVVGHFSGELDQQQELELAQLLESSEDSRRLFLSYLRMEGRLHSLGRDGFLREPVVDFNRDPVTAADSEAVSITRRSGRFTNLFPASLAVCAALVLMMTSWAILSSSVSASSVLQRAQLAAAEMVDRTYHVTILDEKKDSEPRRLTVNVRGGGRFVVRPADGAYVMGSDGDEYWLTRPGGPVWVTDDFRSLAPELKRMIPDRRLLEIAASPNEPLMLGMSDLLSLMARQFNVQLVGSQNLTEHHIRGESKRKRRQGPEQIDLWADPDSGVVQRAEVNWFVGMRTQFALVESADDSADLYNYSEHSNSQDVRRLRPRAR